MGPGSSDRHTSGCQESWEQTSQWLGLAEGSRTWRRKGFCSPPPEDWQELACPGAMLSFSLLSIRAEKKKKFSLPAKTRWQFGGSCAGASKGPAPTLTSFRWPCWRWAALGVPAKAGGLASLGMHICSTSVPNCCAGKELSMTVSRQPAFWDWCGVGGQGEPASPG